MSDFFNNETAFDRMGKVNGAKINKLFYVAASINAYEFNSFIENLNDEEFGLLFPEIAERPDFEDVRNDDDTLSYLFISYKKLGFVAEVYYPSCHNFVFKNNKRKPDEKNTFPSRWVVDPTWNRIAYIYADTIEEMISKIESTGKLIFNEFLAEEMAAS